MGIDKKTVEDVAHLARIELEPKELEKLVKQLEHILGFIDKLNRLNTENIPPTSHIIPLSNVLREDISGEPLPIEKTLMNAPNRKGDFFVAPKAIE